MNISNTFMHVTIAKAKCSQNKSNCSTFWWFEIVVTTLLTSSVLVDYTETTYQIVNKTLVFFTQKPPKPLLKLLGYIRQSQ